MSYKPRSLFRLIEDINTSLFLPHIQRPFVWDTDQMLRLFDSLMQNFPIQTFLFWRTKNEIKTRKFMDQIQWDPDLSDYYDRNMSKPEIEKIFVLDGQQRLQTLYSIFRGTILSPDNMPQEAYFNVTSGNKTTETGLVYELKFSESQQENPWYRIADLFGKDAQRNAEEIADELNEIIDATEKSDNSSESQEANRKSREKRVRRNISQLVSLLREEKHFWVQELDGVANDYPYKKILDIFVRVNSGGTKLDASDLMFAAMKEGWDEIEEVIETTTELLNGQGLQFDKTFPLKCLLVANGRGAEVSPEKFSGEDGKNLLAEINTNWERAETAFQQLRDFMINDLKIYTDKLIRSYTSLIPLFDYIYHNPKPDEASRALMRGYYYKSQLFGWYSKSTDSVVNSLHGIVGKPIPKKFPINEILEHFQKKGSLVALEKSHLLETRFRFIILNLVYVDRMGTSPFDVKFKGNEPHVDHIFPRHATITKLGLDSSEVNHIGNYRFVGAIDNIRKRGELPGRYFARLKNAGIDISKHLLLCDPSNNPESLIFEIDSYRAFRDARFEQIWSISNRIVNSEKVNI